MVGEQDDLYNMWAKPRKMSIWNIKSHSCMDEVYWRCTVREAKYDNRTAVEKKRLFTKMPLNDTLQHTTPRQRPECSTFLFGTMQIDALSCQTVPGLFLPRRSGV